MASYTSYLNLEKPTTSETFNLLKINQNWDKIDAGVKALNSKLTFAMYSSVTDLGLTSGSATIAAVYAAMTYPSLGFFGAQEFASGETPTVSGYVRIEKITTARARIFYYHKADVARNAQMALTADNVPTGTWE